MYKCLQNTSTASATGQPWNYEEGTGMIDSREALMARRQGQMGSQDSPPQLTDFQLDGK